MAVPTTGPHDRPTVGGAGSSGAADRIGQLDRRRRAALAALLADRAAPARSGPIPALPRDGRLFPWTPAQQRIWLAERLGPGRVTVVPNATFGLRLTGPLRAAAFGEPLAAVDLRHESMRTVYRADPEDPARPRHVVLPATTATLPEETR